MRVLALIYDVHGNATALEAVLADVESSGGVSEYLLGGDYCMLGPEPERCVAILTGLGARAHWLRGNTERWIANPCAQDIPAEPIRDACRAARALIGEVTAERLNDAPIADEGVRPGLVFCHASPQSDMAGFFADPGDHEPGLLAPHAGQTIVCGHTHQQFRRTSGSTLIVNPGSVGFPFDGDARAAYGVIDGGGEIELRRVEYDVERAVAAYGDRSGEWVEIAKRRLREARP